MIDKTTTDSNDLDHSLTLNPVVDRHDTEGAAIAAHYSWSGRFALFLAILALFFTTIGIAAGYRHWQRMNDKVRATAADLATLRTQLKDTSSAEALDGLRKELETRTTQIQVSNQAALDEMSRLHNQTKQYADSISSQVEQVTYLQARTQQNAAPADTHEWQVAEINFLLQLANRQLHLAYDPKTAKTSLQEADNLLAKLGSVSYLPVRQQISKDIASVDGVVMPDITDASQRIQALLAKLQPLNPSNIINQQHTETVPLVEPPTDDPTWLGSYKRAVIDALNQAIVVHKLDKPLKTELDEASRNYLEQLLRVRLETLRLMLLQRDNQGFHGQINLITEAIKKSYPEELAKPFLDELQNLNQLNLQPMLPDISGSLKQLEAAQKAEAVDASKTPATTSTVVTPTVSSSKESEKTKTAKETNTSKPKEEGNKSP